MSRADKPWKWSIRTLCGICGKPGTEKDPITKGHIIPRSRGGSNRVHNIRPEHYSCNQARGNTYTRADLALMTANRKNPAYNPQTEYQP